MHCLYVAGADAVEVSVVPGTTDAKLHDLELPSAHLPCRKHEAE